ncbi:unnamed protein product, partial [Closterium sp. NIES-53]
MSNPFLVSLYSILFPSPPFPRGVGYPALLPSAACPEPLDVSNPFTFQLIKGVLQDLRAVFKSSHIHLGGDEVSF